MHVQSVVQHLSESAAVSQDGVCVDATAPGLAALARQHWQRVCAFRQLRLETGGSPARPARTCLGLHAGDAGASACANYQVGTRTLPPSHGIDASPGVVMRGASAPGSARWECAVRHLHAEIRTRGSGRRPADLIASPPREAPRIRWRGHPQELVRQKTSAASGPVPRIGSGFPR